MKRLAAVAAALALAMALAGCSATKSVQSERLPKITLNGLGTNRPVDLGTLKGPMVVNLWASWCVPCKRELPIYADFARAYAGKVSVLGVDFQESSATGATALLAQSHVGYPIVVDPDGKTRPQGVPKLILLDASGKIAYQEYVEIKSAAQLDKLVADHLGISR